MSEQMWEPTSFVIGEPWPWEPEWVAERGFRWLPDSGVLLMVEDNVTPKMCDDIAGPVDLALIATGPLVGLLVRFGSDWDWAETLGWRRPDQGLPENLIDDGSPHPHLVFHVVLVDAGTKQVMHMRLFTVSPHFTRMLCREVSQRWARGTTLDEAQAALADWERHHPTMRAGLKSALARCHGGD